eukprot:TRINITY_DN6462_c0_g2_i1.p1 TRINITY_DN6462_c0_g2~~TRINITY_DN6462_c0_g2_i1.p1  ORF type:complete len:618 (+),score=140.89 TRINITY_DN6462_c0_g2_i1:142-1995(+)
MAPINADAAAGAGGGSAGSRGLGCLLGIGEICYKTPEELEEEARRAMATIAATAMVAFVLGSVIHVKRITWVPESLLVVFVGMLLGYSLWLTPLFGNAEHLDEKLTALLFSSMLKLLALPIIVFESGWSLRLRDFVSQLGYILLFAIIGTMLSVAVVTALILQTSQYHGVTKLRTALAYASLISSVDPVATLATFGHLNVDPLLFILVFGESQINDAVAITLCNALNKHEIENWTALVIEMVTLLFGSIGLGLLLACGFLLILRFARMGSSCSQAILFIFVSCFFTFSFAETVGMSGIITVLFNAIAMGAVAPAHLSAECTSMTSFLLKQMASLADTGIFVCCGIIVVFVAASKGRGVCFGLYVAAFCLVGRFAAIVPLGLLSNGVKSLVGRKLPAERRHKISWKHLFMMWHSGLRGGVSLVLALELGPWVDEIEGDGVYQELVNGTFVIVVLYLVVFGGTTGPALRWLGLPLGDQVPEDATLYSHSDKHGWCWRGLTFLHRKAVLPCLVGTGNNRLESHTLEQVLTQAERAERHRSHAYEVAACPGMVLPHRHQSAKSVAVLHDVYDLFGTTDPAHVDAIEDIMGDLRPAQTRTFSDASTSDDEDDDEEQSAGSGL